jgi:hypothetical protein
LLISYYKIAHPAQLYQSTKWLRHFVLGMKHLASSDFVWRRLFELLVPFTAKLTVFFPHGKLHVLNAASPISARKTRLFVPIYRNFDKDASLQDTLDFNDQVMLRGMKIALPPSPLSQRGEGEQNPENSCPPLSLGEGLGVRGLEIST